MRGKEDIPSNVVTEHDGCEIWCYATYKIIFIIRA